MVPMKMLQELNSFNQIERLTIYGSSDPAVIAQICIQKFHFFSAGLQHRINVLPQINYKFNQISPQKNSAFGEGRLNHLSLGTDLC